MRIRRTFDTRRCTRGLASVRARGRAPGRLVLRPGRAPSPPTGPPRRDRARSGAPPRTAAATIRDVSSRARRSARTGRARRARRGSPRSRRRCDRRRTSRSAGRSAVRKTRASRRGPPPRLAERSPTHGTVRRVLAAIEAVAHANPVRAAGGRDADVAAEAAAIESVHVSSSADRRTGMVASRRPAGNGRARRKARRLPPRRTAIQTSERPPRDR